MGTSRLRSEDILQHESVLLKKARVSNEIVKYVMTIEYWTSTNVYTYSVMIHFSSRKDLWLLLEEYTIEIIKGGNQSEEGK